MDILNSIPELEEESSANINKVKVEDISQLHSSLTLSNPLTYKIFLSERPDLSDEEKAIYVKIINRLERNERIRYTTCMKDMIDADYGRIEEKH